MCSSRGLSHNGLIWMSKLQWTGRDIFVHINSFTKTSKIGIYFNLYIVKIENLPEFWCLSCEKSGPWWYLMNEFMCTKMSRLVHHSKQTLNTQTHRQMDRLIEKKKGIPVTDEMSTQAALRRVGHAPIPPIPLLLLWSSCRSLILSPCTCVQCNPNYFLTSSSPELCFQNFSGLQNQSMTIFGIQHLTSQ